MKFKEKINNINNIVISNSICDEEVFCKCEKTKSQETEI